MPNRFQPAQAAGPEPESGRRWWWVVLVGLLVVVGGLGVYLAWGRDSSQPETTTPPPGPAVTAPPAPLPPPTASPSPTAADRDRNRFRDVKEIQAALELYHAEQKKYPLAPLPLGLGLETTRVLSVAGFGALAQGTSYLDPIPNNPSPGGLDYRYESLDGTTYSLTFQLEEGTGGLTSGQHQATPQGIDGVPAITPPPLKPRTITPPPPTVDSDHDGLTDAEERIFSTDPKKPDTDGDGFLDGVEALGGFDPTRSQGAKLSDSPTMATYQSTRFGYSLRYPAIWLAKAVDQEESEVIFSGTEGEFVEALVVDNPEGLSAAAWYAKQVPGLKVEEVPTQTTSNLTWAWSLDGLNAYLAVNRYLITVSYNIGTRSQVSFYTLSRYMVSSFQPSTPASDNPQSGTGSLPPNSNSNRNVNAPPNGS